MAIDFITNIDSLLTELSKEAKENPKAGPKVSDVDFSTDIQSLYNNLANESKRVSAEITSALENLDIHVKDDVQDIIEELSLELKKEEPKEVRSLELKRIQQPTVEEVEEELKDVTPEEVYDLVSHSAELLSTLEDVNYKPDADNAYLTDVGQLAKRIEVMQNTLSQMTSVGWGQAGMTYGSGEVRLEKLDDVDRDSAKTDGRFLQYQASSGKWIGAEGESAGNPVVSGTVTGTDLILTLDDASTVTIDATALKNLDTSVSISAPNWYQTYASPGSGDATAGAQINTLTPAFATGPHNFGLTLKKGSEFLFDHSASGEIRWIGIWGGGSSYTTSVIGTSSYWTKVIRFNDTNVALSGVNAITKGFDIAANYSITRGTTKFALVYDYDTNKLQLWEVHIGDQVDSRTLITTASVAEDGNPVTISVGMEAASDLPTFTDREHTWDIIAIVTPDADASWHDMLGANLPADTVIKHNTGFHPGEKMVIVTTDNWAGHYIGFDYTGASTGQLTVETQNSAALEVLSSDKLSEYTGSPGFTINNKAERYNSGDDTEVMAGAKISFRYHLDNSMDVFDEDNEEMLFTKDDNLDGSTVYMHLYLSGARHIDQVFTTWTFEPFVNDWYVHSQSSYVGSAANDNVADRPNQRHIYTGTGPGLGPNAETTKMWGELMYPGQELAWTHNTEGFVADERTYIGLRNTTDTTWLKYINYEVINFKHQPMIGFDRSGWYGIQHNDSLVLRYDYDDHKLKFYDLTVPGVETLITTALVAEDGNAIRLCLGGVSGSNPPGNALVAASLRYYVWDYIHRRYPGEQQNKNWRLDRPSTNTQILANTVLQHRRGLIPGQYMRWTTVSNADTQRMGIWSSSSASSGESNIHQKPQLWDWGWRLTGQGKIQDLDAMTFDATNSGYGAGTPDWTDATPGSTEIQLRYNSDDSIDLYDHTRSERILTKDVDGDGNIIHLSVGRGGTISNLQDKFTAGYAVIGSL